MKFSAFNLIGKDAKKFLQGQLTANIEKVGDDFLPTAICNLKGRVQFGLWIKQIDDGFCLVMVNDLVDEFKAHIKKYGAFSKITLSEPTIIYPAIINQLPTFSQNPSDNDWQTWQILSLKTGNYWITAQTCGLFQPQELRLHQRGGVDYDKGCYLGQEIVARLWFKASPKAWLHLVECGEFGEKVQVVNSNGELALVVARLQDLEHLTIVPLPDELNGAVGRNQ